MTIYTIEVATVIGGGGQNSVTPSIPGDGSAGKLLLALFMSTNQSATISDNPTGEGFTLLADSNQGGQGWPAVWGKIAVGSDTPPTFDSSQGVNAGIMLAIESSDGWPAIGSVLAGSSASGSLSFGGQMYYPAHTQVGAGNLGIQIASGGIDSSGQTMTSVDVTAGFTACGFAPRNGVVGGLCLSAQYRTMAGNLAQNSEDVNGATNNFTNRGGLTIELAPAEAAGGVPILGGLLAGGRATNSLIS